MKDSQVPSVYDITYEWPVNIFRYEGRVFGLNIIEIGVVLAGFFLPMILLGASVGSLMVSISVIMVLLLCVRRLERLGNVTVPLYLWRRLQYQREPRTVVLPLIMGNEATRVTIYDPATDTTFTVQ
jgi:hypothetical protein